MSDISDKQLKANQENAKLGGIKTDEGKERSKYNATKHSLLTDLLGEEEKTQANFIKARLTQQYAPDNAIEEILVERIAIWYVRLQRAVIVESEAIKSIYDPRIVEKNDIMPYFGEAKVIQEGFTPKVSNEKVEMLANTYLRYETDIERNLYKAIRELQKAQASRIKGT